MITGLYCCLQLTVQDLPEVPASVSEEINERLDLPDVPTQAAGAKVAEESTKRKGIGIRPSPPTPTPTPQNEGMVKID